MRSHRLPPNTVTFERIPVDDPRVSGFETILLQEGDSANVWSVVLNEDEEWTGLLFTWADGRVTGRTITRPEKTRGQDKEEVSRQELIAARCLVDYLIRKPPGGEGLAAVPAVPRRPSGSPPGKRHRALSDEPL